MEEDYSILQCPACERSVKIKSDAAGTRMGCPYCKEPIEVTESGDAGVPGDEIDDDPVEKPPLVFRRIENSGSQAGSNEAATTATGSVGERRKHRKRNTELYDWDNEKSEDGGGKTDNNDPDDDSSEFLEMDPDTPGGVRLKRVRRKKILTTRDKALRVLTATLFVAAAAIAGFIIYSAIMQTSKVITTEAKTLQELPAEIRALIDQAKDDPITENLTQAEEEIATSVLNGYLNAKTIDERLQFVRDQERVKPIMEKWYADNPEEATKEWPDGQILLRKKIIDGRRYFIILAVDFEGEGKRILAIQQKLDGEMRIDWETSVGYQPMPLEEFKAQKPRTPVRFWVKVKPSDFYSFGFSDRERYRAVELSYPNHIDFKLIGYIDRTAPWAPGLLQLLDAGQGPSLIVEVQYPEGEIVDTSQVEIVSIISNTWWQ